MLADAIRINLDSNHHVMLARTCVDKLQGTNQLAPSVFL